MTTVRSETIRKAVKRASWPESSQGPAIEADVVWNCDRSDWVFYLGSGGWYFEWEAKGRDSLGFERYGDKYTDRHKHSVKVLNELAEKLLSA